MANFKTSGYSHCQRLKAEKAQRRKEGDERNANWAAKSTKEKIIELAQRVGKSKKQMDKLNKIVKV